MFNCLRNKELFEEFKNSFRDLRSIPDKIGVEFDRQYIKNFV